VPLRTARLAAVLRGEASLVQAAAVVALAAERASFWATTQLLDGLLAEKAVDRARMAAGMATRRTT
jgi:hypothetical protein